MGTTVPKLTVDELRARAMIYGSREFFYGLNFDSPLTKKLPQIERDAAVLVLLTVVDGELHVYLTIRSDLVRTHQGEVAFAGGIREPADHSPVETALREAYKEIGLPSAFVTILASLPPIVSRSQILLFPVVGLLNNHSDFNPNLNPSEVSKCFHVPLSRFLSARGHTVRQFYLDHLKKSVDTHFFEDRTADGEPVFTFGITSFICTLVAAGIYRRKPEYQFWMPLPDTEDSIAWKMAFVQLGLRYGLGSGKTNKSVVEKSKV